MVNADIAEGAIGSAGKYDIEFKGGKLVAKVDAKVSIGEAGVSLALDAGAVLDALAKAIPGQVDDAVFGLIKAALLKV